MDTISPLYTAEATASGGGRDGKVTTPSGYINEEVRPPKELGGSGQGTNPEELFAAAYSTCFLSALHLVAKNEKVALPANATITANIGIGKFAESFAINAKLTANLPGVDTAVAKKLVDQAHQVCPYSRATRGNIEVDLVINTQA